MRMHFGKGLVIAATLVLGVIGGGLLFAAGGSEPAAASTAPANMNPTGFPIVKEKVTYKVVVNKGAMNGPFDQMILNKKHEELTNVHIEWQEIPGANFNESKNLIFASGDLPDAFFGTNTLTDSDQLRYGGQGLLIPLEPFVEPYMPTLKALFAKRPAAKPLVTAPNGHMYTLPKIEEQTYLEAGDHFFINKTWLNKVGAKVPETTDELYQALKAFKRDLNGNGKADEIPMSFMFGALHDGIFSIFGAFGIPDNPRHIALDGDKVVFTATLDSYKEGIAYFHKLWSEGLLDEEVFTQDNKQYVAKGKQPFLVYGAFVKWADFHVVSWDMARNDYTYVLPLKGPAGKRWWNYNDAMYARGAFSVTKAAKDPAVLMRWVDPMYDETASVEWCYGAFDHVIKQQDGKITWLPDPPGMNSQEWRFKTTPGVGPFAVLKEVTERMVREEGVVRRKARTDLYRPYLYPGYYPMVYMTDEQNERLMTLSTDITSYVQKKGAEWIIQGTAAKDWDGYVAQLKKMGLDELVSIYQAAYDSYRKNK